MHLCMPFMLPSQNYLDPFEEIGMAEKNAEQHRRSAGEKEVWTFLAYSCILLII